MASLIWQDTYDAFSPIYHYKINSLYHFGKQARGSNVDICREGPAAFALGGTLPHCRKNPWATGLK
jgi:hypothetical protein